MEKPSKQTIQIMLSVVMLIFVAKGLRDIQFYFELPDMIGQAAGILRSMIYIGLSIVWGYSLYYRVTQIQVRQYMVSIVLLILIWITLRTVKFNIIDNILLERYLWYLYYLPILFIPVYLLLAALSLGNPKEKRLPKWTAICYVPSIMMLLLVITNDWHQGVFVFTTIPWDNNIYSYERFYWFILIWVLACFLCAIGIIVYKCRVRYSRKYTVVVLIPGALALLYGCIYMTGVSWLRNVIGDMTIVYCLLLAIMLEGFVQCRLVCSNTNYVALFDYTEIHAIITDDNYNVMMSSLDIEIPPKDIMRKTETESVLQENGTRLSGAPIKRGHVIWSEDVSEILEIIEELADNSEYLNARKSMLKKEVDTRKEEQRLIEKNRLYNQVMNQIDDTLDFYDELVSQLEQTNDPIEEKQLVAKLAVVCIYIKRRGNLIFLAEKDQSINASEIRFAMEEWIRNLRLCGVKCTLYFELKEALAFTDIINLYDLFQKIILYVIDGLDFLLVSVGMQEQRPCLTLNMSCQISLNDFCDPSISVSNEEDGEWVLRIIPKKGDDDYV